MRSHENHVCWMSKCYRKYWIRKWYQKGFQSCNSPFVWNIQLQFKLLKQGIQIIVFRMNGGYGSMKVT